MNLIVKKTKKHNIAFSETIRSCVYNDIKNDAINFMYDASKGEINLLKPEIKYLFNHLTNGRG